MGCSWGIPTLYGSNLSDSVLIKSLEEEIDDLEIEINLITQRNIESPEYIEYSTFTEALSSDEAIVEFIHFKDYFRIFSDPGYTEDLAIIENTGSDPYRYGAFVIEKSKEFPVFVELFKGEELSDKIRGIRNSVSDLGITQDYVFSEKLYNNFDFYNMIWKGIHPNIDSYIKRIIISPSGILNNISFYAIKIPESKIFLSDKYELVITSNSSGALKPPKKDFNIKSFFGVGGLNFDPKIATEKSNLKRPNREANLWQYLNSSKEEVNDIEKLFRSKLSIAPMIQRGYEGDEKNVKEALKSQPFSIIHFSTHGYYIPPTSTADKLIALVLMSSALDSGLHKIQENLDLLYELGILSPFRYASAEEPMVRSGLILSEGNKFWTSSQHIKGGEDNILTSYEIANLNLEKTHLVVLSACETALGDFLSGSEGVFGLQRAFKMSGVKNLIATLWEIDDSTTKDFLLTFYRNFLLKKNVRTAFHETQDSFKHKEPYYWASFVLIE